jgi:membrane protein implicated in regulation of membrane protease activity
MFSLDSIWFFVASILILLEVMCIFNFTSLMAGLAALTVGIVVERGYIESLSMQIIVFCLLSSVYILASWVIFGFPFPRKPSYSDIIGAEAKIVGNNLTRKATGKISWSGTFLPARCHKNCQLNEIKEGQPVRIVEVKGNVAFVIPGEE